MRENPYYIVAYDIRKDKSRKEIADALIDLGLLRVNKSVFEGSVRAKVFSKVLVQLQKLLKGKDSIVCWDVTPLIVKEKLMLRATRKAPEKVRVRIL